MAQLNPEIDHLLRRAGFGVSAADVETFRDMSHRAAVDYLVDYEGRPDDVDARIGRPDHAQVASSDLFAPDIDIDDARQRWLFRMIHYAPPAAGKDGAVLAQPLRHRLQQAGRRLRRTMQAAKMLAHKPGALRGPQGQIELFRQYALGNFRDLLLQVAQDPAMLIWLDGKSNTRAKPQENFGREIMELFTVGVGNYTESDVYAAARVFTGWNLRESDGLPPGRIRRHERVSGVRLQRRPARNQRQDVLVPDLQQRQPHDPGAQRVGRHAGRHRPDHRAGDAPGDRPSAGAQVLELLHQRDSSRRIRRSSRARPPVYLQSRHRDQSRSSATSCTSPWFTDPSMQFARYSWPAEFVVRAIKEVGWQNFSLDKARSPLAAMGSCCSSRRTSADGRSAPAGSRPGRCWRGRISPRRSPPARRSTSPRGGVHWRRRRRHCSTRCSFA